jgi:hypothetical protein
MFASHRCCSAWLSSLVTVTGQKQSVQFAADARRAEPWRCESLQRMRPVCGAPSSPPQPRLTSSPAGPAPRPDAAQAAEGFQKGAEQHKAGAINAPLLAAGAAQSGQGQEVGMGRGRDGENVLIVRK